MDIRILRLIATVIDYCAPPREGACGHPPAETIRVLAALRRLLREGTPWRSLVEERPLGPPTKAKEVTTFSQHDARTVASILRDAAQAEILPRFRGEIAQEVRQKSSSFDLVTDADEAAEAAIAAALRREFPGCTVIGEEASAHDPTLLDTLSEANLTFMVDPIDGTKNFSAGMPLFGVMAAAVWRGEVVAGVILDPIRDDWAMALKGEGAWIENSGGRLTNLHVAAPPPVSEMSGIVSWIFFPAPLKAQVTANLSRVAAAVDYRCAAHQYRSLAAGHYDFALYGKVMPWDHAPGVLIHKEAGGYAALLDGRPYTVRQRTGGLLCAANEESWHVLREALVGDPDKGPEQVRL